MPAAVRAYEGDAHEPIAVKPLVGIDSQLPTRI